MTQKEIDHLKERNEILEQRCERYREIMLNRGIGPKTILDYYRNGKLSYNDMNHLNGLVDVEAKPKPPLGAMPRDLWDRRRQKELAEAMERYLEAGKKIPREWIDEYNEISDRWEEK